MVDAQSIIDTYRKYFDSPGFVTPKNRLRVNPETGKITVLDNVFLWTSPPDRKLPVEFAKVNFSLQIQNRGLDSLEGCPTSVGQHFYCSQNRLTNLIGGPEVVGRDYFAYLNPLESLEGLATEIGGTLMLSYSPTLPLLRALVAKKILFDQWTHTDVTPPTEILNKYAGQGKRATHLCAKELVANGYEANAKW